MTIKEDMKPKTTDIAIRKTGMVKKKPKKVVKPSKVEKEIKQMQKCLKDKDERIETLELGLKYTKENKEYMIRSFNFLSMMFFIFAMFIFVLVCHHFYPGWFGDVAPHFAIFGSFCIVCNIFIGVSFIIFEKVDTDDNDDVALVYFVFNCIVMPILIGLYCFVIFMIENMSVN